MRFLIQGIGSIGQRHYRNIRALGHEVAVLRTSGIDRPFVQAFFDSEREAGNEPLVFQDFDTALADFTPAAIVICTPNHLHLQAAMKAAEAGLHTLIEKPVHLEQEGIDALAQLVAEKKSTVLVGYNLRFHPLLERVKSMVDSKELGSVLSASVDVGENIEDWHPWEDYRDTYAPYEVSGGGSLLCFSHDIDYLFWLLGSPDAVFAGGGKVTPLEGTAEDLVQGLWKYQNGVTAILHIDYWQRPKVRTLKIVGTKKTIVWDAYTNLQIFDHESGKSVVEEVPAGFDRNSMFIAEVQHFIDCIEGRSKPLIPLSDGKSVVEIIERMKSSLIS
ncbi:MAG: gfo/Idh/MocA family oxidoreductase [Parcubacteria group bacterium]|nr:gfo/Idh/MocA family oxidoreductase [Parcubacteria group bacterium]